MTEPMFWSELDPGRLDRDREEIAAVAPGLTYFAAGVERETGLAFHGGWQGTLPRWPFERPKPAGLDALTDGQDLEILLVYPASYPMVPPRVHPTNPKPLAIEHSDQVWHVAPAGHLCLLQSDGDWVPEASIGDLIIKAAGWRIEYALMKTGKIERMTINGIVSDPILDHLIDSSPGPADD